MCRVFQHDLYQLRLKTARCYVSALETSANPVSADPEEPIKISAQVAKISNILVNLLNLKKKFSNIFKQKPNPLS